MKKKWIIDNFFNEKGYQENITRQLNLCGLDVFVSPYIRFIKEDFKLPERFIVEEPVFAYGTIQFIQDLTKKYKNIIAFYSDKEFNLTEYLPKMPLELFLNGDNVFTTFGLFKKQPEKYFSFFKNNKLFIRPNSGSKTFTGQVIQYNDFIEKIDSLEKTSSINDNTLISVSKPYDIKSEYRFIVVGDKVITGSQYLENGELKMDSLYPIEALNIAQKIADLPEENKPDPIAFVCDIAKLSNGDFKVVELNSFSCSDFYQSDIKKAFVGITNYINKKYMEEIYE
tara:strand:+ start:36840 stop:37688 length:849 start_codon:yes stop_codon:yes gene_type:complete